MEYNYLDKGFYGLLDQISDMGSYFTSQAQAIAVVCFVLGFGLGAFKAMGGTKSVMEFIIEQLFALTVYFIIIWAFPLGMNGLKSVMVKMGYEANFGNGIVYEVDTNKGTTDDFYEWIAKTSGGVFSVTEVTDSESKKDTKKALNFNITRKDTGLISLNRCFRYYVCSFTMLLGVLDFSWRALPVYILGTFTALVMVICNMLILINYIMCLVDFYALQTYGILLLPMCLWSGTKSFTENLISGIGKIGIKLLVITSLLYLTSKGTLDIFVQLYESYGEKSFYVELFLVILFKSILYYVLTKQTTEIAGFLSGGMPQLSFGEFAQGMQQAGATARTTKAIASSTGKALATGASTVGASAMSGSMGAQSAKGFGGNSFAGGAKGAIGSLANSIGGGLKQAGGSLLNGGAQSSLRKVGNSMSAMMGVRGAMSQEGIGLGGGSGSSEGVGISPESNHTPYGNVSGNERGQVKNGSLSNHVGNVLQGKDGAVDGLRNYANKMSNSDNPLNRLKGNMAGYASYRVGYGGSPKDAMNETMQNAKQTEWNRATGGSMKSTADADVLNGAKNSSSSGEGADK